MPLPTRIHAPPRTHTCVPRPTKTLHTLFLSGPTVGCYALCPTDMLYWNNSARYYSIYFDGLIIIASAPPSLNPHGRRKVFILLPHAWEQGYTPPTPLPPILFLQPITRG